MEHYEIRMEKGFWTFRQVDHLCNLGRAYSRMQVLVDALFHLKVRTGLLQCGAELEVFRMKGGKEMTYTFFCGEEPTKVLHPPPIPRGFSRTDPPNYRGPDAHAPNI